MDLVKELGWRGMLQDIVPGTQEQLVQERTVGYVGFDPTASSLHIGNLVPITLLKRLQIAGHSPIALIGGATGMVGDPSGKSAERNLLSEEELRFNESCVKKQLEKFLDFNSKVNPAILVNNIDWFRDFNFLDFLRNVGKHISISYMMSKDSVRSRLESGLSFTEFSYQLVQGYDFYHLNKHYNCKLQMGGSDQWGNMLTGSELVRRMEGKDVFALTCPLITKSDGSKFGKTEDGNIWLDPERTSPYKFYQFWINAADNDAAKLLRTFSFLNEKEINDIEQEHMSAPHERVLQKKLAELMTTTVHSKSDYDAAVEASLILFGKATTDALRKIPEKMFLSVFEGVPQMEIPRDDFENGLKAIELLVSKTGIFSSNGEARKMIDGGGVSINKEKVSDQNQEYALSDLINGKYMLVQKGRKNYFLLSAVR